MLVIKNTHKIRHKEIPYYQEWHVKDIKEIIMYAPNTRRMGHYYDIQIVNPIKSRSESILLNREPGDNRKSIANNYELHCIRDGAKHVKLLTKFEIENMGNLLNWIKLLAIEYK